MKSGFYFTIKMSNESFSELPDFLGESKPTKRFNIKLAPAKEDIQSPKKDAAGLPFSARFKKKFGKKEDVVEIMPSDLNPPPVEVPPEEPPLPEPPAVLDPDHPLLEKFQTALKEHLLRQIDHLNEEIMEIETDTKKKDMQREELGVEAYEFQQIACKQQLELETCLEKLRDACAARETLEHGLEAATAEYKQRTNELMEAEKAEMDLRNEVEALNLLLGQLSEYEAEIESELMVNHRISDKAKREKKLLLEEKRQQDIMIYKWMTQVWALESEIDNMNMQLRVKEAEREKLAETATQCNIEVEAFEAEYRCLMHSWNSVIIAISNRDKVYNTIRSNLSELQSKSKSITYEIENVKRATAKLIDEHELTTLDKNRFEYEIQRSNTQIEDENKKNEHLERQIYDTQSMIDQLEKDIRVIVMDNNRKRQMLANVKRELEGVLYEKVQLEEELVEKLQQHMLSDKEGTYVLKLLKKVKAHTKELEIVLANKENLRSKLLMDTETQKFINGDLQRLIDDMVIDQKEIEGQISHYQDEKKNCEVRIHRKQREIDTMIKKIERQALRIGEDFVSPLEQKVRELQRTIEDLSTKNRDLQKYWLREQTNIVNLSEQRQEQLHELNFLRKQTTILQQRNLKIEDEMNMLRKQGSDLERLINKAQNRLAQIDSDLTKKKSSKSNMDKQIDLLQLESIGKLKDAELECLRLDSDIAQIEEDKQNLTNKLIELNREALGWEKKLKMALEAKQNMVQESNEGGEVGTMRLEIHRMRVRYSQLKKAQDKLINDLQHCVARRESIFTTFEAREKRAPQLQEKTQINFNRKLDDMRNKLRQLDNDVVEATEKMEQVEQQKRYMSLELREAQEEIQSMQNQNVCLLEEIESMRTQNLTKLLLLSLKQKKLQTYTELSKGRTPRKLYRTESVMDAEIEQLKDTNQKLIKVVTSLKEDFPERTDFLDRIYNVLTVHVLNDLP